MSPQIHHASLRPSEFEERLRQRPVAYLPLGTLEWHGVHGPLGADLLQAEAILERAADRFGGIVLPPIWLGPDTASLDRNGTLLIGMDQYSEPQGQLPGSLYWIPEGLFLLLAEHIIAQAVRAGFRCIVAEGHGPSRDAWHRASADWQSRFAIHLLSAGDFPDGWATQNDHAGRNETSVLMATEPDLVDLARLPASRKDWPRGVIGEDPRDSTPAYGEQLIERTVRRIGSRLDELGV